MNLVIKLALGHKTNDQDIADALYEICDDVHASCDSSCPVYELNGNKAPGSDKPFKENRGCDCFKSGSKMLSFIRNNY